MRQIALLLALAFFVGCGDEPDFKNQQAPGTDGTAGTATETEEENTIPEAQKASPEATELTNNYRMAKNAQDPKKAALKLLLKWEGRTLPADALYFLGLLHQYAEQWDKAANVFAEFVEKAPDDPNRKWGLYSLVDCLIKAGRESDAGRYVTMFGEKYPEEAKYWRSMESTLAAALAEKGKLEEAAPHYGKALELGDYYSGEEWVMVLTAIGKYDEARAAAKKLGTIADGEKEQARAKDWVERTSKMGKPAPELQVAAWTNPEDFDRSRLEGKVVLIYFWRTNMFGKSKGTQQTIQPIYEKHANAGLAVIGLSKCDQFDIVENKTDESMSLEDEIKNLKNWVFNIPTPWPLALAQDEANHEAFVYGGVVPTMVILDAKGHWRYYRQGHDPKGFEQVEMVIERLVKE